MCVELFYDCVYCIFLLLDQFRTQNNAVFNLVKNIHQISFGGILWLCVFAQGSRSYKYLLRSRKRASFFPPIRFKSKTNCVLVTRVFPRFWWFCIVEISLAPRDIFFCSDWLLWLLCFCFYDTFTTAKIFKYKQTF